MDNCSDEDYNYLVDDCLKIIFKKLQNRDDENAFGLTCKQWFRTRNTTRDSLFFGEEGLSSKNSKEITTYLPKIVSRYSSLRSISLPKCVQLTNSTLDKSKISGLNLKTLSLSGCKKLSDKYLAKFLINCPNLVTLNLDSCNVTNYVLKFLANSSHSLQNIILSNCIKISDHGIVTLFQVCPKIKALTISHCKGIRGMGFKKYSNSLTHLIADSCWFSSKGIVEIFGVEGLEYLNLSNVREVRVFGEDTNANAKSLKFLNLSNCKYLHGASLTAMVRGSPLLEELNLANYDGMTSTVCNEIGLNCKKLRVLNANGCIDLDDMGLRDLAGCDCLEILYIRDCSGLNENDVEIFNVLRPNVAVLRDECSSFGPDISGSFG